MTLPELSRDERAALAFLLRTAAKFGPEKCWPKIYSIGLAIGKKPRTITRIMTALIAFGIIERVRRGPESSRYRILLNLEQLIEIIGLSFRKDGVAFGVSLQNAGKVKEITAVKARKRHAIGVSSPSLCPPTPPKLASPATSDPRSNKMQMPYFYTTVDDQKLWRMAQRWIAINDPDLSGVPGDKATPIMHALEAAGALKLPEDGPLPMITWAPLEAVPLVRAARHVKTAAPVNTELPTRKPMGIAESDLAALSRKVSGSS